MFGNELWKQRRCLHEIAELLVVSIYNICILLIAATLIAADQFTLALFWPLCSNIRLQSEVSSCLQNKLIWRRRDLADEPVDTYPGYQSRQLLLEYCFRSWLQRVR